MKLKLKLLVHPLTSHHPQMTQRTILQMPHTLTLKVMFSLLMGS